LYLLLNRKLLSMSLPRTAKSDNKSLKYQQVLIKAQKSSTSTTMMEITLTFLVQDLAFKKHFRLPVLIKDKLLEEVVEDSVVVSEEAMEEVMEEVLEEVLEEVMEEVLEEVMEEVSALKEVVHLEREVVHLEREVVHSVREVVDSEEALVELDSVEVLEVDIPHPHLPHHTKSNYLFI